MSALSRILADAFLKTQLEAANARIKNENAEANPRELIAVKREAPDGEQNIVAGRGKRARQEIEIVDLTLD